MSIVTVQRIDGQLRIKLPEGVTSQDLVDYLNNKPYAKNLDLESVPEKWTTAELPDDDNTDFWRNDG